MSKVVEEEENTEEEQKFHISFRDRVEKKSLIKVIEVESFKKYNSNSN